MKLRVLCFALLLAPQAPGLAEPYLAVQAGLKCQTCHVNTTGGGMRNAFGNLYAQQQLAAQTLPDVETWTGSVNRWIGVGGDLRAAATMVDTPDRQAENETSSAFDTQELRVYLAVQALPNRVLLYVDQRLAPGGSLNLESYARLNFGNGQWLLKAGQFYLPYGLRLEDDSALVRRVPGITFDTPDDGVELAFESARWTAQFAVSNGSAGTGETDQGKQYALRAEHVRARWRAGASLNYNDADAGERRLHNVFAGLRTGPLAWLAELDYIEDESLAGGTRRQWVGLIETNWNWARGQNLKLSAESFDPDDERDEDEQLRGSLVWEWTPLPFLQSRAGARVADGQRDNDAENRKTYFWELHGFF